MQHALYSWVTNIINIRIRISIISIRIISISIISIVSISN